MKIAGRTFVVSGGSSGLGLATTLSLLSQGANVSILNINAPPGPESLPESSPSATLLSDSSRVLYTSTDVSSTESIQSAVDATVRWIKDTTHAPLGGVVACAGVAHTGRIFPKQDPSKPEEVKTMPMEGFDRVITINLRGTVDLLRLVVPHMAKTPLPEGEEERGAVVLVSSVAAFEGQVGQVAYSASKAALAGIVLPLARELGKTAGIRVAGIAPGVFGTAMTGAAAGNETVAAHMVGRGMVEYPLRLGKPEEFASFAVEILKNGMLNGNVFRLDGAGTFPSRL